MESRKNRGLWQAPWGYPESFVIVVGVVIVGLTLQMAVGSFDFYLLARPINYIVAAVTTLLSIALSLKIRSSSFARWIVSLPLSVALISALLILTIVMGLTIQKTHSVTPFGFDSMTSNWAFVMIYSFTLFVLGAVVAKRARNFRVSDIPFYLNHIGLYILLISSGLGYSDMQRYIMYVNKGETQWRVYDKDQNIIELPIAIYLEDFRVEFYPSKPIYFDAESGEIQKGSPQKYKDDNRYKKIMAEPEPKHFSSQVEVYTQQGESISASIEVNSPLRVGSWSIYQYGYDNHAGNLSSYSSFELVYDSWITEVYLGIIMMMVGSVTMIITGRKK